MQLGATFSHPHLKYLKLDPLRAMKSFNSLGLKWIRLGCYWNEIEEKREKYNFSQLDPLVKHCDENKIDVVMTVGMKGPRWPEYHIPDWLNFKKDRFGDIVLNDKKLFNSVTKFIRKCVERYKKSSAIKAWQVENEPLDPSGPDSYSINKNFLQEEINLVQKIDKNRKILVNLWGNESFIRGTFLKKIENVDTYGLDIYPRLYSEVTNNYIGPVGGSVALKFISKHLKRKSNLWITELQAEPWEPDSVVTEKNNPPSFFPNDFERNLDFVLKLKPELILLWGFEYWLWRKEKKGDDRYWKKAKEIIEKYSNN